MSPATGPSYRLQLALRSLASARDNLGRQNWRDSAVFSRAGVEHAVKAIVACFGAVPRSHEPQRLLAQALETGAFPDWLRERAEALSPDLGGLGIQEHILLSYGDEERGIDPWSIVDEARATSHFRIAEAATALAEECVSQVASA
ncbi:MAG TPA: HEPN domain-containing protein [Candidatus Krumholzibacteria bacterium]